ncbi:hypothetical protein CATRI_10595 [Corynebacterium atrinae]|uniref:hypothetical protein n=1 Tax=Corynebacterium atrinae TaxID=1336740 RepID=UPI0025B3DF43|nr:hypothetical protein [Corynebacterium atrinae]WJY64180.1 hypothetical protein CATRI_10595 [Corynebacterium atrinae]
MIRTTLIAATGVSLVLALTACSNSEDTATGTITQQPPASEEVTTEAAAPQNGEVGNPISIATLPGNDVTLTITEITVGEECRYGTNDYGGESDLEFGKLAPGQQYLQIWADVEVTALDNPQTTNDWIMLRDPDIIDAEGYTQSVEMSVDCRSSDEGHESWSSTVDLGDKMRVYEAFVIPGAVQKVRVHDIPFEIE